MSERLVWHGHYAIEEALRRFGTAAGALPGVDLLSFYLNEMESKHPDRELRAVQARGNSSWYLLWRIPASDQDPLPESYLRAPGGPRGG